MKKEILDKWVAALESGKYRQTTRQLVNCINGERSYCCLGVLCEVIKEMDGPVKDTIFSGAALQNYAGFQFVTSEGSTGMFSSLNDEALKWTGLNQIVQSTLISMNDSGASFPEIAKWLKEEHEKNEYQTT